MSDFRHESRYWLLADFFVNFLVTNGMPFSFDRGLCYRQYIAAVTSLGFVWNAWLSKRLFFFSFSLSLSFVFVRSASALRPNSGGGGGEDLFSSTRRILGFG